MPKAMINMETPCTKCNRKLDCTFPCLLFWKTLRNISEINYAKSNDRNENAL